MTITHVQSLARWINDSAFTASLDADADLGDLEPLRDLVGDARVVALGESAHYIPEFHLARHRLLRFLAERMGFSTYALEAPFTAGREIGAWIDGGDGDIAQIADAAMPIGLGRIPELHGTFAWLREHNRQAHEPITFIGTDVPGSGGSIVPALEAVRAVLLEMDPDALPLMERAIQLAHTHDAAATFAVLTRYATVSAREQDELSALLSRLLSRLETMARGRVSPQGEVGAAFMDLRGAWYADHLHRDIAGRGLASAAASRDAFMGEVVLNHVERKPNARVVVASHNVHIQKVPSTQSAVGQIPQGEYLSAALGSDYRAIAITAAAGRTAQIQPNPALDAGFEIREVELTPVERDSLDAHLGGDAPLSLVDLRHAPSGEAIRGMRMEGYFLELPALDAFDAVAWVSRSSVSDTIRGGPSSWTSSVR
jgi:erythromycin esterase